MDFINETFSSTLKLFVVLEADYWQLNVEFDLIYIVC